MGSLSPQTAPLLQELVKQVLTLTHTALPVADDLVDKLLWSATERVTSSSGTGTLRDESAVAGLIRRKLLRQGHENAAESFQQYHKLLLSLDWAPDTRCQLLQTLRHLMWSSVGGCDSDEEEALNDLMAHFNQENNNEPVVSLRLAHAPFIGHSSRYKLSNSVEVAEVPEFRLVRDCVFVAQGLEGNFIRFAGPHDGLPIGDVLCDIQHNTVEYQVMRKVAELGWLTRRIQALTDVTTASSDADGEDLQGRVRQAFGCAARRELHTVSKLMAYLESFLPLQIPQPGTDTDDNSEALGYLTLRRLVPWVRPTLTRLRLLAAMADTAAGLKGGALVSAIAGFAQHGDLAVQKFATNILRQVCIPLLDMVKVWLFEGRIDDPCREFFIVHEDALGARFSSETALTSHHKAPDAWLRGYRLEPSMQPPFVTKDLAQTIFKAGKSIHFLRECCNDQEWSVGRDRAVLAASAEAMALGQVSSLEHLAQEAYQQINRHLMDVLFNKHQFEKHCVAIKRYLLLGQGDFIQALMDAVGNDLNKRAVDISEYSLNASLDTAIRASNAQYDDQDVMDRLRIRLDKATGVETGWDVFMLHYEMEQPLSSIIHRDAANGYLRMFRLLWSMKRVEYSLSGDWKLMTIIERKLGQLRTTTRRYGLTCPGLEGVWAELRHSHRVLSEMSHFVTNMQYYLHFEVMEASWETFCKNLKTVTDLESLVAVHDAYVGAVLHKALLSETALADRGPGPRSDVQRELHVALRSILDLAGPIKRLNELVDGAFMEAREYIHAYEDSYARGTWNRRAEQQLKGMSGDQLAEIHDVTRRINMAYGRHQAHFVQLMANQAHVDTQSFIYRMTKEAPQLAARTISVPGTLTPRA